MAKYVFKPKNTIARLFFGVGILSLILEIVIFVHLFATKSIKLLNTSFTYILNALTCNFSGLVDTKISLLVISASVIFYLGIIIAIGIFVLSLIKKRYNAIFGSAISLIIAFIIPLDLSVISTYIFSKFSLAGVISIFFLVISIILIVLWIVSSTKCIKHCLELRYNYETNFVIGVNETQNFTVGKNYQEVDKEIVNVVNINDNESIEEEQEANNVAEQSLNDIDEQDIVEEQNETDNELDEEIAHLQEETEEDEDDALDDPEEDDEENESSVKEVSKSRKRLTFAQKLLKTNRQTKQNYKIIRKYLESLGFKSKVTKTGNSYLYKNNKYVVIATSGKTGLRVYFKLNLEDYENSKIPLKDVKGVKKYEKTPIMLKVKSNLSVKRAKNLINDIKSKLD